MKLKSKRLQRKIEALIFPLIIIMIWELGAQSSNNIITILTWFGIPQSSLPDLSFFLPPSRILPSFITLLVSGKILPFLWDTTWRTILSFLIAGSFGVLVGMPLGISKKMERLLYPTVDALRSIPPIALLPLMILFFGIENKMKVLFICFGAIWPVVVNTAAAFKGIENMWVKVAHNCGYSDRAIIWRVMFPAALPQIFPGLRICLSLSLILSIVCEMISGNSGLGHFLNYSKRIFEFGEMFSTIFFIAILGWILNSIFIYFDGKVLAWHYQQTKQQ